MDNSFFKTVVEVPKLSGFDKSFHNLLTTMPGTITPILFDEVIPAQVSDITMALSATLPPLASDTFMRCSVKVEAFFVPMRLLYGGFEAWFTGTEVPFYDLDTTDPNNPVVRVSNKVIDVLPTVYFNGSSYMPRNGSLFDYLGFRDCLPATAPLVTTAPTYQLNLMPFLGYHLIWQEFYRAPLIQNPCFARPSSDTFSDSFTSVPVACLPYVFDSFANNLIGYIPFATDLADGVSVLSLRQRNFGFDYFSVATPSAQLGSAQSVSIVNQQFTVEALRIANSMQQFLERNNYAGDRFADQLRARYGANLSEGVAQRPILIGTAEFECYSKGVDTNAATSTVSQNPFSGQVGNTAGKMQSGGQVHIVDHFKANEPGYIYVMATLVPRAVYSSGVDRILSRYVVGDIAEMANPILSNVGQQPIYASELSSQYNANSFHNVFGYTDRYADFKIINDQVHGIFKDGDTLESFVLQRSFNSSVAINSSFLEIPTNFLDQITAVSGDVSKYGVMIDSYFDYKASMPLPKYAIPSLQDPAYEHGDKVVIRKGGFRF